MSIVPNRSTRRACLRLRMYSSSASVTVSFLVARPPIFSASSRRRSSNTRFVATYTLCPHMNVCSAARRVLTFTPKRTAGLRAAAHPLLAIRSSDAVALRAGGGLDDRVEVGGWQAVERPFETSPAQPGDEAVP